MSVPVETAGHVTLRLPRALMEVVRLSVAHQTLGVRPWAEMPDEEEAQEALRQLEGAQAEIEAALRGQVA